MPKYRKKPVVIEAVRYEGWNDIECLAFCPTAIDPEERGPSLVIPTLEGDMRVSVGDYIIKGIQGEFYPCKPDIFEATYELVAEEPKPYLRAYQEHWSDEENERLLTPEERETWKLNASDTLHPSRRRTFEQLLAQERGMTQEEYRASREARTGG